MSLIDTEGEQHTAANLVAHVDTALEMVSNQFPTTQVVGCVTDGAANMVKMRSLLGARHRLFTYRCQAHLLNLAVQDACKVWLLFFFKYSLCTLPQDRGISTVLTAVTVVTKAFKWDKCCGML